MASVVDEVVARHWPGRTAAVEALVGGITNENFKVDLGDECVVVRVPSRNSALLGIDRANEVAANELAARAGVAPELVLVDEPTGCIVTRFVDGRAPSMAELATEPLLGEVVAALRTVHSAGVVPARFNAYAVVGGYRAEAAARQVRAPFDDAAAVRVLASIASVRPYRPAVLGHNDLLNANFLYDTRLRILDWEYAGMADELFDLANFSVNNELGADLDGALLAHYYGRAEPATVAALRLYKLVSELREAFWGVLQIAISDLDVDFVAYAAERGERFFSLLGGYDLDRLLAEAAEAASG